MNDEDRQRAGIPLFRDKKIKDGWTLNIVKQNEQLLSTSLYNASGKMVENKMFMTQDEEQIKKLKQYVSLFEAGPDKSYKLMTKIKLR